MSQSRWLQFQRLAVLPRIAVVVSAIVLHIPRTVLGIEATNVEVTESDGVFHIRFSATLAAHADYVRYVLGDSAHIYRLSPSIIESEVLPAGPDGEKRVRTRVLCCTAIFCREVERVDTVRMLASGDFEAEIVPSLSEFKSGKATWKITPMDDRSLVVYEAYLEPDFFIPPIVGTQMVIDNLRDEFTTTFTRVERIASVNAKRDTEAQSLLSDAATRTLKPPCEQNVRASLQ